MDLSFVHNDSTHTAGGQDSYPAVPASNPWGQGGAPSGQITPVGTPSNTEAGFYDGRDDMVGGSDTPWNVRTDSQEQSGANWYSYGDSAPVFNSASGLGGPSVDTSSAWTPTTEFTGTKSQQSLAGGTNPESPYGH